MMRFFLPILLFVSCFGNVWAASTPDTFIVQSQVFGDVTPPTTPAMVSVTPITYSQIDVEWGTATDDIQLGGYQLFRDGTAIATTSLTTYSDTGLSGSTTYSYSVRAFDISKNYSGFSGSLATTTPEAPIATTSPTSTPATPSPTRVALKLTNFSLDTTPTTAQLRFSTNNYARYTLRWGRGASYELGYTTKDTFALDHATRLTDLEPGTTYEYELIGYSRGGNEYVLRRDRFTTAQLPDVTAPANVSNLTAQVNGADVTLSWINPTDPDFAHVRVVRSHLFFPETPADGFVVYQGSGGKVFDAGAFNLSPDQYYTVFSYDERGNISSGAIIQVRQHVGVVPIAPLPSDTSTDEPVVVPGATSSSDGPVITLRFTDLIIRQNGKVIAPQSGRFAIDGRSSFTVSLPYELLPEHLKTITVTLYNEADESFSFLLRVNKDKTAYEATLAALGQSGVYRVSLSVFDFSTKLVTHVTGALTATFTVAPPAPLQSINIELLLLSVFLLVMVLVALFLLRRRRRDTTA